MAPRSSQRTLPNLEIARWPLALAIGILGVSLSSAQRPVLPSLFADPSARVFDDTVYVYVSHDVAGARDWSLMKDWHVLVSRDLKTWTDHGKIFGLQDIRWAEKDAWAPDCIARDGKFYLYFPAGGQIGVAVSDSPVGPFRDALGEPLIKKNAAGIRYVIDPHIFVDDDGQAYLYFGGGRQLGVVKIAADMITLEGPVQQLAMPQFYEGVWIHKQNEVYYATYPTRPRGHDANVMIYSTASSPSGPFDYQGPILDNQSQNIHGSVVEFNDQSYLFYHAKGPSNWERQVCVEKLNYTADGSLIPMQMSQPIDMPLRP